MTIFSWIQTENAHWKRTSILDGNCFNYEQLFHPVQRIAFKKCQGTSIDKLVLLKASGILSLLDQRHYL